MLARRIEIPLAEDLKTKMVLLSGPRQCGKTTLARARVAAEGGRYYSWDIARDRLAIQKREVDLDRPLWIFDELHKFKRWRAFLKDLSDSFGQVVLRNARERRLPDIGPTRVRVISAARLLANLP